MRRIGKGSIRELEAAERQLKRDWTHITVDNLKDEIIGRGLMDTTALKNSITGQSGDDVQLLTYLMYGKFVDMDVRRGRNLEGRQDANLLNQLYSISTKGKRAGRRQKKHQWYSRRIRREQRRLAELMVDLYGDAGVDAVLDFIPKRLELKM